MFTGQRQSPSGSIRRGIASKVISATGNRGAGADHA